MGRARERRQPASPHGRLDPSHLEVVRFRYVPAGQESELLGLSLHVPEQLPHSARPTLLLEREEVELLYAPRLASSSERPVRDAGPWLWRGIFSVPVEVSSDPAAAFALRLFGDLRIALP